MKKFILSSVFAAFGLFAVQAQKSSCVTPIGSLNIVKEIKPAILNIVPGSVEFVDATGNNAIDANESCKLRFKVKNSGKGDGFGCKAKISATGSVAGLSFNSFNMPVIKVGETAVVEFPIKASMSTLDGSVVFTFQVDEPNDFGTDPMQLAVNTRAFEAPYVQVADYTITGETSSTLEKKKPFDLQILFQNTKYGTAENVSVSVELPANVNMIDTNGNEQIGTLGAGETQQVVYSLITTNSYSAPIIPIKVKIREKYGKYAEDKVINLAINQSFASSKLTVQEKKQERQQIVSASLSSAVDKNIPVNSVRNNDTYAVIIANENYNRVEQVPYALNDGNVFRQYCEQTLGIPAKNIKFLSNATLGDMKAEINWIKNVIGVSNGEASVIFYYAGHGIPDESNKSAFLLPVDGYGSDVTTAYRLDDLYSALTASDSKSVTVFLDACFSGAKRDGKMLASARGVAIKAKMSTTRGNMVVFSAAQGDETALAYETEKHGMFTYYLLKKLQETKGDVSLKTLGDYIVTNVRRSSVVENHKNQTPSVSPSLGLTGWENWKLK